MEQASNICVLPIPNMDMCFLLVVNRENTARAAMDGERYSTLQLILDLRLFIQGPFEITMALNKGSMTPAVILQSHEQKFGA